MKITRLSDIKHESREVDLAGQTLGRVAVEIAQILVGKNKPYFVRHLDCGDFVTVKNLEKIKVTGKKEEKKVYTRYSGYPGGIKKIALKNMDLKKVLRQAVWGMLPNNKLRDIWVTRLKFSS
jgi:large subunit ribosomal protein L13